MSDRPKAPSGLPRETPGLAARYGPAWVPIPLLLLAILALWVADLRTSHESRAVLLLMNVVFTGFTPLAKRLIVSAYRTQPDHFAAVFDDITARTQAEEALRASNQELEEFNRAMVGRELRMIELKQEINVVCAQLGQPPRYPLDGEEVRP